MDTNEIQKVILKATPSNRSFSKDIHKLIIEQEMVAEVASIMLDSVATSIANGSALTQTARRVATRTLRLLQQDTPKDYSILRLGTEMLHWMALTGLIDVDKYPIIETDRVKEQWFVVSKSQEYTDYAQCLSPEKSMLSPIDGAIEWTQPIYHTGQHRIPIVKKAERYQLLPQYGPEEMPDVYLALNKLNRQCFRINESILELAKQDFIFQPQAISEADRSYALRSISDTSRKAKFIEERQFEEMNKWLLNEAEVKDEEIATKISKKKASERSQDYFDTVAEPHQKIISDWSKRMDFEKILMLADSWRMRPINYLFNMDTRGRIYAIQNYLTPLGSDIAKAMLTFYETYQVSGYDLCVHIANCFGQDKLSFEDRVEWVNDNSEMLQKIGYDPLGSTKEIKELGLEAEQKTKWQGVAACVEYSRYCDYVDQEGTEEGFETDLIIGLDSTSSGTQLLTIFGRDHVVAPYVNVSAPLENKVGDFYTFLSNYLRPKLEEHRGTSKTLDAVLDDWKKHARKLSKRNSMTFSYSGTKWGFGQQHWEDRHSYGPLGSELTRSDCRILGNAMFEVCEERIKGGAEIMKWLREGIDHHEGGAVISWTMPDGFKAFQVADASKANKLKCVIGSRQLTLSYYVFQDKPKKSGHKNGISPNWVHSFDAYLLREIVRGMPDEAPISTVHDQFSTTSYFIQELQEVAKRAYKTVGDRTEAERTCEEAFGKHRPLPLVGDWDINEINKAEFIIC